MVVESELALGILVVTKLRLSLVESHQADPEQHQHGAAHGDLGETGAFSGEP